eukprot:GILI01012601.1.p1 GENE.GILI01012601.1~~GILI01012601.1.p1  ORF type:complete len:559 (+),score=112.98 GILI01012601.1:198-1874(+)
MRSQWTQSDDDFVRKFVDEHGPNNWNVVASMLSRINPSIPRTGKQCRERYWHHLHPSVIKGPFTEEEKRIMHKAYTSMPNQWSNIARLVPGRTDNQIKNYFNSIRRKGNDELSRVISQGFDDDDSDASVPKSIRGTKFSKKIKKSKRSTTSARYSRAKSNTSAPRHFVQTVVSEDDDEEYRPPTHNKTKEGLSTVKELSASGKVVAEKVAVSKEKKAKGRTIVKRKRRDEEEEEDEEEMFDEEDYMEEEEDDFNEEAQEKVDEEEGEEDEDDEVELRHDESSSSDYASGCDPEMELSTIRAEDSRELSRPSAPRESGSDIVTGNKSSGGEASSTSSGVGQMVSDLVETSTILSSTSSSFHTSPASSVPSSPFFLYNQPQNDFWCQPTFSLSTSSSSSAYTFAPAIAAFDVRPCEFDEDDKDSLLLECVSLKLRRDSRSLSVCTEEALPSAAPTPLSSVALSTAPALSSLPSTGFFTSFSPDLSPVSAPSSALAFSASAVATTKEDVRDIRLPLAQSMKGSFDEPFAPSPRHDVPLLSPTLLMTPGSMEEQVYLQRFVF